jgi:hypothetical protein
MALNSFTRQDTVDPEAVQPRFLNDDDREGFSGPRARFPPELRKTRQQRSGLCHVALGLRWCRQPDSHGDDENQLRRVSFPA